MPTRADVLIVGGGIAGLSLAAAMPSRAKVVLLEAEGVFALHSSGRSARQMQPSYGPPEIRALTGASIEIVDRIVDLHGQPFLAPRPLIWFAQPGFEGVLGSLLLENPLLREIKAAELVRRCPGLREDKIASAAIDEYAFEVQVPALVDYFAARAREGGVDLRLNAPVTAARHTGGVWRVSAGGEQFEADTIVNAAGPWADHLAGLAGIRPLKLAPHRRTVVVAKPRSRPVEKSWAMVSDVAQSLYFRPDGQSILMSLSEEERSEPEDAQPLEADIALLLDRMNSMTDLDIRHVEKAWTGLRTFTDDHLPVVGYDSELPGFFWLAGQGGYGIQTAAALSRLAASAIAGEPSGLDASLHAVLEEMSPTRTSLAA